MGKQKCQRCHIFELKARKSRKSNTEAYLLNFYKSNMISQIILIFTETAEAVCDADVSGRCENLNV